MIIISFLVTITFIQKIQKTKWSLLHLILNDTLNITFHLNIYNSQRSNIFYKVSRAKFWILDERNYNLRWFI